MDKIKKILILVTLTAGLLFSSQVLAAGSLTNGSNMPLAMALLMEAFISIHMSVFVLLPLAAIFKPDKKGLVFWILFSIRIAILLFFDFFVTTNIAVLDFFAVFVGAFIIVPISSIKTFKDKANITAKIKSSLESTVQNASQDTSESVETVDDGSPVVAFDEQYLKTEKTLLKEMLTEQLSLQGEDAKKFEINSASSKKDLLLIILIIVSFVCSLMFLFNAPLVYCALAEIVALCIYLIVSLRYSTMNVLMRKAKKNPDKEIFQLIVEAKAEKKEETVPRVVKLLAGIIIAIAIPFACFYKPTILYLKYGNGYSVFRYTRDFTGSKKEVIIPDTYKGKDVIAIGENAFKDTKVRKVLLPKNLESIKTKAFYNCEFLESINIPKNVFEIRASAFEGCHNLKNITLPERLKEIRARAFADNYSLVEIELPGALEYLGAGAFSCCSSLREITIPEGVTEINGQTFEYCTSLKKVNMHDNIISIHGETFVGDVLLDNVVLPSKITEVKGSTFEGCSSLSSIVIPEGVTRIGGHAFHGCRKLESVTIPSTLKEIGSSAFRQCRSLKEITLPKGTIIDERSFKESPTRVKYI